MKKKETPKAKAKEFSISPFKALKGVSVGGGEEKGKASAPARKEVKPAKPKSQEQIEDEILFMDAMSDVRRLGPAPAAPARPKGEPPAKTRRDEEDERVFLQAIESLKMDVRFTDELPEAPRPAPVNRLRQVRRGGIRIDLQLDLHGLTKDEALENLERFVRGAYNRGQKGVLVITGKGNNSSGEPVLKAAVAHWLRENGKGMITEFVQAPNDMGGGGAFVVFLREKKVEEEPAEG